MSNLRVMLNKLVSDWQVARAVLEDEYKVIGKTTNKIRSRHEFVAHLLDVHRLSCEVCLHPVPESLGVRSDRDTAVDVRASAARLAQRMQTTTPSQRTDGLEVNAPDTCVLPGDEDDNIHNKQMAFQGKELQADVNTRTEKSSKEIGIKQEHHESIGEKEKEQREENEEDGWIDDDIPSSLQVQIPDTCQRLADTQSNLERSNQLSYVVIKEEEESREYCDVDVSSSHQRTEEATSTRDSRSDLPYHLKRPNKSSYPHIRHEEPSQEHYEVDMDSINVSTSHQMPEYAIPTHRSDEGTSLDKMNKPSTSTDSYYVHSAEGSAQGFDTDWNTAVDEPSVHSGSLPSSEHSSQDMLPADGICAPSGSTHNSDVLGIERSNEDMLHAHAGGKTFSKNSTKRSRATHHCYVPSPDSMVGDGRTILKNITEHSRATHHCYVPSLNSMVGGMNINTKELSISRSDPKPQSHCKQRVKKVYLCKVCGTSFALKTQLYGHMRTHTGRKQVQCSFCGKMIRKGDLTRHMRTHTGEKPYQCTVCMKHFNHKGYLTTHMSFHFGEKPFKCSVCATRFTQKTDLNKHMRIHTGENPYQCNVCGRRFTVNSNMNKHMKTHKK